jgi:phospholipase C
LPLADIETVVIVMMENRSFDHMVGYLSLSSTPGPIRLEGLSGDPSWQAAHANPHGGKNFTVHRLAPAAAAQPDPPHDHTAISTQISTAPAGPGLTQMGGFVESYTRFATPPPSDPSLVMGYFDKAAVPMFDFFARNYCLCDHWFSAVPLGTQANRLMGMAGESVVFDNAAFLLPHQPLVYDWLSQHKISWCAYQWGDFLPFFSLMPSWIAEMGTSLTASSLFGLRGRFRRYTRLKSEWNSKSAMPSVIFIEPEYTDGPHASPNDDHPPTGVGPGQAFLADLYKTLTSNPARWAKTMLIVTYDEHGGFFDHVPPLPIPTKIAGQKIATTGVRVPAFVISPHVAPGSVFTGALDHTSVLQFLDDRFGPGTGYSPAVMQRQGSLNRLINTLAPSARKSLPPAPRITARVPTLAAMAKRKPSAPNTPNANALDKAARKFADDHPELVSQPGWEKMREYLATNR